MLFHFYACLLFLTNLRLIWLQCVLLISRTSSRYFLKLEFTGCFKCFFTFFFRFHYFLCRVESHGTISVYMHGYIVDLLRWGRAAFALDRRAEVNNLRTTEKLLVSYFQRMSLTSVNCLNFFTFCPIDCWFKQFHTSDSLKRVCFEADAARILANASTTFATFPIKCCWQRYTWQRQT